MSVSIEWRESFLRVLMRDRTADDLRMLAGAVIAANEKRQVLKLLIRVEQSRPLPAGGEADIIDYLERASAVPGVKIALVSDSDELHASHLRIMRIGEERGVSVKAFGAEPAAVSWLLG